MSADEAIKRACRIATPYEVPLSGLTPTPPIDGVILAAGDRVLVKEQSVPSQNGIWVAASGGWTRATDFDGAGEAVGGALVLVTEGDLYGGTAWRVSGNAALTVGTDPIPFELAFGRAYEVERWGAIGNSSTDDTAAIQAAFDEIEEGGTLLFGAGKSYQVTDQITIDRRVNVVGSYSTIFGVMADDTKDILHFEPATETRMVLIEGMRLYFNEGGRNALYIGNGTYGTGNGNDVGLLTWLIQRNMMTGGEGGYALYLDHRGTHFINVVGNHMDGGHEDFGAVHLRCADGCVLRDNLIGGIGCGVRVALLNGSYKTRILDNGIVSRDVGVEILAGQQVDIGRNHFEQGLNNPGTDENQATHKAHIVLSGGDFGEDGEEVRDIRIIANNFGSGSNQDTSVIMVDNTIDVTLDDNVFANRGDSGIDIQINSASCKWTRIGNRNRLYGLRGGLGSRAAANSLDPKTLLLVTDYGTGTYGYAARKGFAALTDQGTGWSGSTFLFWKDEDDRVHFEGNLSVDSTSGANNGNYLIGKLPDGFRPAATLVFPVSNTVGATPSGLAVHSDGAIRCDFGVHLSSSLYMGGAAGIPVKGRSTYLSGPV